MEDLIRITCVCGKRLRAKSAAAGKSLPCPSCGKPVSIPFEDLEIVEEIIELEAVEEDEFQLAPLDNVKCSLCGASVKAEQRLCRQCQEESAFAVSRRSGLTDSPIVAIDQGLLIARCLIVSNDQLTWGNGTCSRSEIEAFLFHEDQHLRCVRLWVQVVLKDQQTIRLLLFQSRPFPISQVGHAASALADGNMLGFSLSTSVIALHELQNEVEKEKVKGTEVEAQLNAWLEGGTRALERKYHVTKEPKVRYRLCYSF